MKKCRIVTLLEDPQRYEMIDRKTKNETTQKEEISKEVKLAMPMEQLMSLQGIEEYAKEYEERQQILMSITIFDAKMNRLKVLNGIEYLKNVKEVDLSLNQIQGENKSLASLTYLTYLNFSNNLFENMAWCEALQNLKCLVKLDVSMNRIQDCKGVSFLSHLQDLNMKGNLLVSLAGLEESKSLCVVSLQNNHLENITALRNLPSLSDVYLSGNNISGLDKFIEFIAELSSLERITCYENPIEKEPGYRYNIIQNTSINMLDHLVILPETRTELRKLRTKNEVEELMQKTTFEYMTRVQNEKKYVDKSLVFYRKRQENMLGVYSQYKKEAEKEIEECRLYTQSYDEESSRHARMHLEKWTNDVKRATKQRIINEEQRNKISQNLRQEIISDSRDEDQIRKYENQLKALSMPSVDMSKNLAKTRKEVLYNIVEDSKSVHTDPIKKSTPQEKTEARLREIANVAGDRKEYNDLLKKLETKKSSQKVVVDESITVEVLFDVVWFALHLRKRALKNKKKISIEKVKVEEKEMSKQKKETQTKPIENTVAPKKKGFFKRFFRFKKN